MNKLKIRCSSIGDIVAKATKGRTISVGAETYVKRWLIKEMTGKKELQSYAPALLKGTLMEDIALDLLSRLDGAMYIKNDKRLENEYLSGEFDCLDGDTVIDIKCPFDAYNMPYFDTEPPKGYWCQLQGYMALTGATKARLVYMLVDAPEEVILSLEKRAAYNGGNVEAVRAALTFNDVPRKLRKKEFSFNRDEDFINNLYARIDAMREYASELIGQQ
jgi:hypothetical protein